MVVKSIYVAQPYEVGSKNKRSLALIIPAQIVRQYGVSASSVFKIRGDTKTQKIFIDMLDTQDKKNGNMVPTEESLQASPQQAARAQ